MKIRLRVPHPEETPEGYRLPLRSSWDGFLKDRGWVELKRGKKWVYVKPPEGWVWEQEVEVPTPEEVQALADYCHANFNDGASFDSDTTLEWVIEERSDQAIYKLCKTPEPANFPLYPECIVDWQSDPCKMVVSVGCEPGEVSIWAVRYDWDAGRVKVMNFHEHVI